MPNYCPNCGNKIENNAAFCANCGRKLSQENNYQNNGTNTTSNVNNNGKSKLAAGILGIVLGSLGIHNFYLGYTNKAIAQLFISSSRWTTLWNRNHNLRNLGISRRNSNINRKHQHRCKRKSINRLKIFIKKYKYFFCFHNKTKR